MAVLRHPRARRLRLRYDAKGNLLRLTMPPRGSMTSAREWVAAQHGWIVRQLETAADYPLVAAGSVIPFRNGELTIDWRPQAPRSPAIHGTTLAMGGPEDAVGRRVARWLTAEARRTLTEATMALAGRAGLPIRAVTVGDPRSRWGSCSASGNIRYSWRLMMMPDFVRDSVVAHEVAHLRYLDHSPRFHRLAADLLGADPDIARAWLRRHGPSIQRWQFV